VEDNEKYPELRILLGTLQLFVFGLALLLLVLVSYE
jgi:hypothetical protein